MHGVLQFDPLAEDDLPFLVEVRNECRRFLHDDRRFTVEECIQWFATTAPDFHMIRLDGSRVGYFRLGTRNAADASISIGADLHPAWRGRGLGRRGYETFMPVVRDRYEIRRFDLEVLSHNTVARALYERLGFVEVGRVPRFAVREGAPVDSILMSRDA